MEKEGLLGDTEMMSDTYWPCVTLSFSFTWTHLCIFFFLTSYSFYAIRKSQFNIVSYQTSKAIIPLLV